jgi:EAL domain-containing protein (putative c-di-GMP-specific phosphodiesterase class I)/CheY-like chemotaxis protein
MTAQALSPIVDGHAGLDARTPLCLICDPDSSIRHLLSLIMQSSGVDAEEYADGASLRQVLRGKTADLVFIDVALDTSDAMETIATLAREGFKGAVQLMSSRGMLLMDRVIKTGEQNNLKMLPGLKKPFDTAAVQKIVQDLKIGLPPSVAARLRLDEALESGIIEFWYQPRIDLRRKRLIGVEAYARARHPQFGILSPDAFMPGANPPEIAKLAELAIRAAVAAERQFATVGVHLPVTLNIDVATLTTLPLPDLVADARHGNLAGWPGLIIDIPEKEIASEIALATELDRKFSPSKVKLAIDDVGRAQAELSKTEAAPFAEYKIDGMFVVDAGSDKVNAPICRAVIDLAHRFGGTAAANGLTRAADILALASMGCNLGQGPLLGPPMPEERFLSLLRQRAATQRRGAGRAA